VEVEARPNEQEHQPRQWRREEERQRSD
jgi:hypothetical protein